MNSGYIRRLPILVIYPWAGCNCRCIMCNYRTTRSSPHLSVDQVHKAAQDGGVFGLQHVVFSGGEPLLHPDLPEMLQRVQSEGIRTTVLTNGLQLANRAQDLASHIDECIVSLDGPPAVHDAIRGVRGAYRALEEGIRAVRALDSTILISGRCTVQARNAGYLVETVMAARQLGLDHISFLSADVVRSAFGRSIGWESTSRSAIAMSENDYQLLHRELLALEMEHAEAFRDRFISETPEKLHRTLLGYVAAVLGRADFPPVRCNAPMVSAVIEADGHVRPCFFHAPQGHIDDGSLGDILNSTRFAAFRRSLDTRRDPVCRPCICTLYREES